MTSISSLPLTVLTKSLKAPSSARFMGRHAAGDGGESLSRHKTERKLMDYVRTLDLPGDHASPGRQDAESLPVGQIAVKIDERLLRSTNS